jgi:hypothetical protein
MPEAGIGQPELRADGKSAGFRDFWILAAAWLIPRSFFLAKSFGAWYDIQSYSLVEAAMHHGRGLYSSPELTGRYPYLPGWALILWGLGQIGRAGNISPWVIYKLPGIFADAGIMGFLFKLGGSAGEDGSGRGFWVALAYALNPVSWMVTAGHGQFDALVLFFLLGALSTAVSAKGSSGGLRCGLWLGAAVSLKIWPLFLFPLFLKAPSSPGRRWAMLAGSLALPLGLGMAFAIRDGLQPLLQHLAYAGVSGVSLPEAIGRAAALFLDPSRSIEPGRIWKAFALGALGLAWCRQWLENPTRPGLVQSLGRWVLLLILMAPAVSAQYLLWPLPFVLLMNRRLAWLYSLSASILLLIFYLLFYPGALYLAWLGGASGMPDLTLQGQLAWIVLNLAFWAVLLVELRRAWEPGNFKKKAA